jgi:hypothetical protein
VPVIAPGVQPSFLGVLGRGVCNAMRALLSGGGHPFTDELTCIVRQNRGAVLAPCEACAAVLQYLNQDTLDRFLEQTRSSGLRDTVCTRCGREYFTRSPVSELCPPCRERVQ